MSRHQSHGTQKQDRPAWRWQGRGRYTYTSSPEAARYVAMCRQREIDKLHKVVIVKPITDSARLIAAASRLPDRAVA